MFTIADICSIAVQIEENGEATYRKAAANCNDTGLADLLNSMANEERQHAKWFRNLNQSHKVSDAKQQEMESMGRDLLREMVKDQTFSLDADQLSKTENLQAFLEQSIAFENDTVVFYEMLQGFIEDAQVRFQLDRIIAQERDHIHQIQTLKTSKWMGNS
jgi:rubrerythrin